MTLWDGKGKEEEEEVGFEDGGGDGSWKEGVFGGLSWVCSEEFWESRKCERFGESRNLRWLFVRTESHQGLGLVNCTRKEIDSGGSQEPCRSFKNEKGGGG